MNKKIITILIIFLISCQDLAYNKHIVGKYYLIATDTYEQIHLAYEIDERSFKGIVDELVVSVGFNNNYIIVKQTNDLYNSEFKYYIVKIINQFDLTPERTVIGPFKLDEFNNKIDSLGININFSINIEL